MTAVDLPEHRPASPRCVDELAAALGSGVDVRRAARERASRDHAWLSPILQDVTPGDALADVVVAPADVEELHTVLAIAHRHQVAVTPRGRGTGNYGQAIPLAQGIVVDLAARFDSAVTVESGWMTAGAGATFTRMEAAAAATGQELAMFPSTTNSTLGGFLSGGAGGTGSIEHGFIWDGFVDGLAVSPCWDVPEIQTVDATEVDAHLHAYGTTGVITEATIRLVPARSWTAVFASFPTFGAAIDAAWSVLDHDPRPRSLSVDDPATVESMPRHEAMIPGRASLRAIVAQEVVGRVERTIIAGGGDVTASGPGGIGACVSSSYNHVTLRAKRLDPTICHLQVGGAALLTDPDAVAAVLPGGRLHLDAHAPGGVAGFGGLLLSTFVDAATLRRGIEALRDLDVFVIDPHTWSLDGHGATDAMVAAALHGDPSALLNPGKLDRSSA